MDEINVTKLLSLEEFKSHPLFDESMSDSTSYQDNYILETIYISEGLIDWLSGYKLFNVFESLGTKQQDIKNGLVRQVNFMLRKGIEYSRETNSSLSVGSVSIQTSNPDNPMFIVPELYMELDRLDLVPKTYIDSMSTKKSPGLGNYFGDETFNGQTKHVSWLDFDTYGVQYSKIKSSDNSILRVTPDNPYNQILDLIVNMPAVVANLMPVLSNSPELTETINKKVIELLTDNKEGIISEVVEQTTPKVLEAILQDQDFLAKIKTSLLEDQAFLDLLASKMPPIDQASFNVLFKTAYETLDLDLVEVE